MRDYDLHFITLALTEAEQSIAEDEQSRLNVGVVIAREHVNWRAHTEGTTSVSRPRQDARAAWLINDVDAVAIFARHQH